MRTEEEPAAEAVATAQADAGRTGGGAWARDIDGDGDLEFAGANPLYLGITGFGVTMVIASMMTWAQANDAVVAVTQSGMQRIGVATMILGAALVILGLVGWAYNPWSDPEAGWSAILGLVGSGLAIWQMIDISGGIRTPDIGAGLWLLLITSIATLVLSLVILIAPEP